MRLINSTTLKLEDIFDDSVPKYAILSHRWGNEEVSLQDMQNGTAVQKAGYAKIKLCCDQAVKDGLQYSWVDTCCIDKTSSAELSESINSMYRWYQKAVICYAFLPDVHALDVSEDLSFRKSAWFTRGWTLQELIGPSIVEFYNSAWNKLGTKDSLADVISVITSIDVKVLKGADPMNFSIAKRMSWASKRTTTKIEDIAYSLLGIFDVNMPMLYGEGGKAFIRLQEEIMKHSDDHSIFAWTSSESGYRGLLAKSPAYFSKCRNIVPSQFKLSRIPYSVTNMGLSVQLPMIPWAMETYFTALDCEVEGFRDSRIGIFLARLSENSQWARVMLEGADRRTFESELISKSKYQSIHVRQRVSESSPAMDKMYGFWLRKFPPVSRDDDFRFEVTSWNQWNDQERLFKIPVGSRGTAGVIVYSPQDRRRTTLRLGFDFDFNPMCEFGNLLMSNRSSGSFESKMSREWMDTSSDLAFKGDRNKGLDLEESYVRIVITEGVVRNQRVWIVYISDPDEGAWNPNVVCDGCDQVSFGMTTSLCPGRRPNRMTEHLRRPFQMSHLF